MKRTVIAIAALVASAGVGYGAAVVGPVPDASSLNAKAFKMTLPNDIKWGPAAGLPGTDAYVLVGDPAKPGFYVVLNRFHPGNFSRPHYHANDRYIMVISGTWWADTGATWDPEKRTVPIKPGAFVVHPGNFSHPHYHANDRYIMVISGTWWADTGATWDPEKRTVPIKPGTFVMHPGREVHYDGSRAGSEEAIVMIFGEGPGTRHECEGPTAEKGPGPCEDARKAVGK